MEANCNIDIQYMHLVLMNLEVFHSFERNLLFLYTPCNVPNSLKKILKTN